MAWKYFQYRLTRKCSLLFNSLLSAVDENSKTWRLFSKYENFNLCVVWGMFRNEGSFSDFSFLISHLRLCSLINSTGEKIWRKKRIYLGKSRPISPFRLLWYFFVLLKPQRMRGSQQPERHHKNENFFFTRWPDLYFILSIRR